LKIYSNYLIRIYFFDDKEKRELSNAMGNVIFILKLKSNEKEGNLKLKYLLKV